jgi:hypothetical protein
MGQVQTYGQSRAFLVGDFLTTADLLVALALHPIASGLAGPELQDLSDAVLWINRVVETVGAPLPPIALTAVQPKRKKPPPKKLK